jgi:hypothetical protein
MQSAPDHGLDGPADRERLRHGLKAFAAVARDHHATLLDSG